MNIDLEKSIYITIILWKIERHLFIVRLKNLLMHISVLYKWTYKIQDYSII
jgi:hypothetical protein